MKRRKLNKHERRMMREWQHTAACSACRTSFTWNGKIRKGQVGEQNYVCGKCGRPMRVYNHKRGTDAE